MPTKDGGHPAPEAFSDRYGPWAEVTGGAEGTGAAFAEERARRGRKQPATRMGDRASSALKPTRGART